MEHGSGEVSSCQSTQDWSGKGTVLQADDPRVIRQKLRRNATTGSGSWMSSLPRAWEGLGYLLEDKSKLRVGLHF